MDGRWPTWPGTWMPGAGVVYVATGTRFVAEARVAAASMRAHNPGVRVCLVTDAVDGPAFWDDLVLVTDVAHGFRDKILMGLCPYERFVFLDTDTHIIGNLSDVFALLERFDFVAHQLFEGHDCPVAGIPDAFPEFNTGVLGFRRSAAVGGMFARWLQNYDAFYAQNAGGQYHYSNASDQKSLRKTIYESELRLAVLGPEYNFVPHHVNFACAPVRVIHTRGDAFVADLTRRLNAQLGNRAYVPLVDAIASNSPTFPELVRLWRGATTQLFRRVLVAVVPRAMRDAFRRRAFVRRVFLGDRSVTPNDTPDDKWHAPESSREA
jgi:hypothetical protein